VSSEKDRPQPETRAGGLTGGEGSEGSASGPRSLPPVIPSLPPPAPRPTAVATAPNLSKDHPWLADPRLVQIRLSVADERLVEIREWGIDPSWTTNQITSHVHAILELKADRRVFEDLLRRCDDKADLMELVYSTLTSQPPEVAARRKRGIGR
jgi:hypothetical protein